MPARGRRKNFAAERADPKVQLFDAVRDYLDGEQQIRPARRDRRL